MGLTQTERETARQLLACGWTVPKVAHALARKRERDTRPVAQAWRAWKGADHQ